MFRFAQTKRYAIEKAQFLTGHFRRVGVAVTVCNLPVSAAATGAERHKGVQSGPAARHVELHKSEKVILFGLARRTARKSRKHHYFTLHVCDQHSAAGQPAAQETQKAKQIAQ